MRPTLIQVPYHLGRRDFDLGRGVPVLAEALADERCDLAFVRDVPEETNENAGSFAVIRAIAEEVRGVEFPIVLAGNCGCSLGTVTGIGGGVGVVWLDAHADFNTPETTRSGFIDGMSLAMLTGSGWEGLRDGLAIVPEEHVVLVGARDLDVAERERLERSAVTAVRRPPLEEALDELRTRVTAVYVHVDLDVLDPSVGVANQYAAPDGLSVAEVESAINAIAARFEVRAAAIAAYRPDLDPEGAIPPAARAVYERLFSAKAVAA